MFYIIYLKVIFCVWLSRLSFITGHLVIREKAKSYPWAQKIVVLDFFRQPFDFDKEFYN